MAWGEEIEYLQDLAAEGEYVEALDDYVAPLPHLAPVWEAFFNLSGSRHLGQGLPGNIPFGEISHYAERFQLGTGEAFARFHRLITLMDGVWLSATAEKLEAERERQKHAR